MLSVKSMFPLSIVVLWISLLFMFNNSFSRFTASTLNSSIVSSNISFAYVFTSTFSIGCFIASISISEVFSYIYVTSSLSNPFSFSSNVWKIFPVCFICVGKFF